MALSDSITYAVKSLTQRRLRSWLTIIGIFIGIAAVVSLIALGQGLQGAIAGQLSSLGADSISVEAKGSGFGPPGLGAAVVLTTDDLRVVQKSAHVEEAAGRLIKPVNIEHDGTLVFGFIASLPEEKSERDVVSNFLNPKITHGRFISEDDTGKVTIGAGIAESAKWNEDLVVGKKIDVEGKSFEIVGILERNGIPASDRSVIINEDDAREILGLEEEYSLIQAKADNPNNVALAKEAIAKDLRKSRDVEERKEDFTISTNEDTLATLNTVLGVVTGVLVGIAAISLLVGGIGIMNTMYTAVIQRYREIGIMKAIGASNSQVLQIFLIEAGLIGLVGAIIGVIIGVGLSKLVEVGARQALGPSILQASTPLWLILGALAFGFVVGTVSGYFPAKRAASLPPVEALR